MASAMQQLLLLLLLVHLGIVFLEALGQALLGVHKLLDAAGHALALAVGDGLGGEVVGAGSEAVVDEAGEEADKLLHLALLEALLQLAGLGKSEASMLAFC